MKKEVLDASTEEKIINAAKKIFTLHGYAGAKMRDIALEADINLALINYYFRSKQKLFEIIVVQNIDKLFNEVEPIFNDELTSLLQKIQTITEHYIDLLTANPDFPLFIVNELLTGDNDLEAITSKRTMIKNSFFAKQMFALNSEGKIHFHPLHISLNILGMIIFPFLGRNWINQFDIHEKDLFAEMMKERKKLVPLWIKTMINQ